MTGMLFCRLPFMRNAQVPLLPSQLRNMSKGSGAWRPVGDMEDIEAACQRERLDATLREHVKISRCSDSRI